MISEQTTEVGKVLFSGKSPWTEKKDRIGGKTVYLLRGGVQD